MIDSIQITNYIFHVNLIDILNKRVFVQPRFSSKGLYGYLFFLDGKLYFKYELKNAQNSKGQHIVIFYENKLIGGGLIEC